MKPFFIVALLITAIGLAGCRPKAAYSPDAGMYRDRVAACDASIVSVWTSNAVGDYYVEARSKGDDCSRSKLSLTFVDDRGQAIWIATTTSEELFGFDGIADRREMKKALRDWITQPDNYSRTGALPKWRRGKRTPDDVNGFPFYPDKQISRRRYEALRRSNRPLFCFVQGKESVYCLTIARHERRIISLGIQTFPG